MGKYSKILLNSNVSTSKPKKSYASKLFNKSSSENPLHDENLKYQPDQYVENPYESPFFDDSIKEGMDPSYKPADFSTMMKAGFVDNEESRIDLFAKARGIPKDRYTVKDGEVFFKGNDGKFYPESPRKASTLIKKLISELPSEGLADIGAAVGARTGGVPGAMAGAGAGEFSRKIIGKLFFGDEQTKTDYAADMGVQAILGSVDAGLAKKLTRHLSSRKIKKATGGKISNDFTQVVGDLSKRQRSKGKAIKEKGKKIGVDLLPHQAMDDPTLTGYYKLLRDNPKTARAVRANDDKLEKQIFKAGNDLIKSISDKETDAHEVGERLSKAGAEAIENMKKVRGDAVKDLYDKVKSVDNVDVTPALEEITRLKAKVKPGMKAHSALNRIERMLKADKFTEKAAVSGLLPSEKKTLKKAVPENRLEVIDNVKQEIDAIMKGKDASTITNKMKRKMQGVKDILTTQTDKVSREYQVARALFTAASPKISKTESGIVGVLSRMTTDEIKEKAVKKIFASPHSIRTAKKHIMKNNPGLWQDAVAELFRDGFEKSAKVAQGSGGKVLNRSGKYASKMWDLSYQKKLKIATEGMVDGGGDPLFNRISDFFEVMEKASIGQGKESATWERAKMEKGLQGMAGKLSASVTFFRQTLADVALKSKQDKAFDKNAKKLLQLMQTSHGVDLIARAKGYGPRTEKGLIAATTLLLMATESNIDNATEIIQTYQEK